MKLIAILLLLSVASCRSARPDQFDYYNMPCYIQAIEPLPDGRTQVVVRYKNIMFERPFDIVPDTFRVGRLIYFQTFKRITK